ncbi:hypothetical protein [Hydrogenophaga sp. 5NK40-0174]|uniref:hypothetical protein n=1 Tax=Hydrogenophaga sp. 5NK40-0174 TaxID=3127649 RepID=UPI00333EE116
MEQEESAESVVGIVADAVASAITLKNERTVPLFIHLSAIHELTCSYVLTVGVMARPDQGMRSRHADSVRIANLKRPRLPSGSGVHTQLLETST